MRCDAMTAWLMRAAPIQNAPDRAVEDLEASDRGGIMRANCWISKRKLEVERVADPKILNSQDAIVPFADVGPLKIENGFTDEQVLFLSDIFPTGYMAAEACDIKQGDTIAVWGCGPVGQFAMKSAFLLGAERVIGIDRFPERLQMAREKSGAETIDYEHASGLETLNELTGGQGPDACIDAVGME